MDREAVVKLVTPHLNRPLRAEDRWAHRNARGVDLWPYMFIIMGVQHDMSRGHVMIDIMWRYGDENPDRDTYQVQRWRESSVLFEDYVLEGVNDA